MSKGLTFYLGKNEKGEFVEHKAKTVLIAGLCGSGKTVLLDNIISQLILTKGTDGFYIAAWDAKGEDLVSSKIHTGGVKSLPNCTFAATHMESSIFEFMEDCIATMSDELYEAYGEDETTPGLIVIDGFDSVTESTQCRFANLLGSLMTLCRFTNNHLLLAGQGVRSTCKYWGNINNFTRQFDLRVCLHSNPDESMAVIGTEDAAEEKRCGYCYAVGNADKIAERYSIPFYSEPKKREILSRELLPQGCKFEQGRLEEWARYSGIAPGRI